MEFVALFVPVLQFFSLIIFTPAQIIHREKTSEGRKMRHKTIENDNGGSMGEAGKVRRRGRYRAKEKEKGGTQTEEGRRRKLVVKGKLLKWEGDEIRE